MWMKSWWVAPMIPEGCPRCEIHGTAIYCVFAEQAGNCEIRFRCCSCEGWALIRFEDVLSYTQYMRKLHKRGFVFNHRN